MNFFSTNFLFFIKQKISLHYYENSQNVTIYSKSIKHFLVNFNNQLISWEYIIAFDNNQMINIVKTQLHHIFLYNRLIYLNFNFFIIFLIIVARFVVI